MNILAIRRALEEPLQVTCNACEYAGAQVRFKVIGRCCLTNVPPPRSGRQHRVFRTDRHRSASLRVLQPPRTSVAMLAIPVRDEKRPRSSRARQALVDQGWVLFGVSLALPPAWRSPRLGKSTRLGLHGESILRPRTKGPEPYGHRPIGDDWPQNVADLHIVDAQPAC